MSEFGEQLRSLLDEQGVSMRHAARAAGYSASYLANVIAGRKPLTPSEELSIPVDEEFQAAAASSSSVAVGDVAFASGA